jgi:lysophospholipase L1-like esterase
MTNEEQIVTDAAGFRDRWDPALPDLGVVAIGDSETFGHGVPADAAWPEQLEQTLGVNVYNAGVFGYAVTQYEPVLRRLVRDGRRVTLVLLAMSWNDVPSGVDPPDTNTVRDGFVVTTEAARQPADIVLRLRSSAPMRFLLQRTALGRVSLQGARGVASALGRSVSPAFEAELDRNTAATRAVLESVAAFLAERGARLAILHIGDPNFVIPEAWVAFSRRHAIPRDYARQAFAGWASARGIAFGDAIDALEARYVASGRQPASILLEVDGHYGPGGQAEIARAFADLIARHGLL